MSFSACLLLCLLGSLLSSSWAQEAAQNGTVAEARARCVPGDLYYKQYCYQFCNTFVSWYEAEVMCQEQNGPKTHLASILSASEGRIVSAYLKRKDVSSVWVGLQTTRSRESIVWEWSDASPVSQPLWDGCSLSAAGSSDQCVSMINIQNTDARKSQQCPCTDSLPFLCKYQAGY